MSWSNIVAFLSREQGNPFRHLRCNEVAVPEGYRWPKNPNQSGRSERITKLIAEWERRARKKLADAEREQDEMGRALIVHGATCYVNAAQELREILRDTV